jgi:Rieske Fe-S protein
MADRPGIGRRAFVRLCVGAAGLVAARPATLAGPGLRHDYPPAILTDRKGPVTPDVLETGRTYVFHYPYATTPCFLIDLGRPTSPGAELCTQDGGSYRWPGGVGPEASIVAFSAICAHRMSHPARSVSFIDFRAERVRFLDTEGRLAERERVIRCCSENSVYDPGGGARVLGGPAQQPLAAIGLDFDPGSGRLTATCTYGGEMFEQYFERFGQRLALEFATFDLRRPPGDTTEVVPLEDYSAQRIRC